MEYKFKALDEHGKQIKSIVVASTDEAFYAELQRRHLQCIDYRIVNNMQGKKYRKLNLNQTSSF